MDLISLLAEERIKKAEESGEFRNLPGTGKPLVLEDLSGVPEDMRMSYKVLKNAGYIPPEMELQKEIVALRDLLRACTDDSERADYRKRISEKEIQYEALLQKLKRNSPSALNQYRERIENKLT
ncbi:DnaJ family domain-containing protein [Terribacillus sp. 179-K 1B1 HS]|uniref:DnaJ family domain-containing protein n=1 Tax=Terribacillus sp. 179-K 1B1 HS TaxID=3142388 RepID=UPI00399F72B7